MSIIHHATAKSKWTSCGKVRGRLEYHTKIEYITCGRCLFEVDLHHADRDYAALAKQRWQELKKEREKP